jgi:hypothetical protein
MYNLNSEFAGGYSLGNYFKNGTYVTSTDYAPNLGTSGGISFSQFFGAKKNTYNGVGFGSSQNWTVPYTNIGYVNVYVQGGGGGGGMHGDYWGGYGGDGGPGGVASATVNVSPNGTYYVEVGGGGGAGHYGYGYKDNPFADGFPGYGGGQSSFNGLYAGGGGGGSGTPYGFPHVNQDLGGWNGGAGNGGGGYGGHVGYWGYADQYGLNGYTTGGAGGANANDYGWGGQPGYGGAGTGGHNSHDNSGGNYGALSGPGYANGQQGVVYIYGWW